ncbi:uncharacterized protein LOC116607383 [Nematostella vectensis]|uniref:uncharacterized protein LOC116607383 n=1 Tax=Nematostella vectensis TaxID=45351 RepID=UPI0020778FFB|nr:uncharacterized protein LOC116607383 [Nematostella vectensis]
MGGTQLQNKKLLFGTLAVCVLILVIAFTELINPKLEKHFCAGAKISMTKCKIPAPTDFSQDKKDIARKLLEVNLLLKADILQKRAPAPDTVLKLEAVIEQLEPEYSLSKSREKPKQDVNTSVILDVCPEEYRGENFGYPFFHTGWELSNCSNARSLPEVITILLNTIAYPEQDDQHITNVLQGINSTYPGVQVILSSTKPSVQQMSKNYPNVSAVIISSGSLGAAWNQLAAMVKTPYTLIARDLVHFDFNARLERQIRMISDTDHVGVVGGAFRNLTGHWRVGCRQSRMFNYVLSFQEGYHYSRKSCMFCSDLEGPFVATTDLLKSVKFNEILPKEVVFEDFFIRVTRASYLVMNCPDVMYYTTDYSSETKMRDKAIWREFATKWVLVRVALQSVTHSFSCSDISYKCSVGVTKYAPLPKCCLEQFSGAMRFLQEFAEKNNVAFELDAGSVLAAVKFSDYNPFDLDGDISMLSWNFSFIKDNMPYFKKNGYTFSSYSAPSFDSKGNVKGKGYFMYYSPDIYTECYGFADMSANRHLPKDLRDMPHFTKALIGDSWINIMFSPGLFARNRYGLDILKHSQSWLQVGGMGSSWGRYKPGQFLKCSKPDFHSCLEKFPADGNLAFIVD